MCEVYATIIDNIEVETNWFQPVVQFNVNGNIYTVTPNHFSGRKFLSNNQMKVYYDKNNPNELTNLYGNQGVESIIVGSILLVISLIGKKEN